MTDGRLLVPAMQAARNLGISRRTLRRHIGAGLVRSVTVSARTYIPQGEIERIVNGEPVQTKPESQNEVLSRKTTRDSVRRHQSNCQAVAELREVWQNTDLSDDQRFQALKDYGLSEAQRIDLFIELYGCAWVEVWSEYDAWEASQNPV